jgi:hypothetical protein
MTKIWIKDEKTKGPVLAPGQSARYYDIVKNNSHNFLDVRPYSSMKVKRSFEEAHRLHIQGRTVSQRINRHEAGSKQKAASCWSVAWLTNLP